MDNEIDADQQNLGYLSLRQVQATEWIKDEIQRHRDQHPDRFDLARVEWGPSGIPGDLSLVPGVLVRCGEFRNAVRGRNVKADNEESARDFGRKAIAALDLWRQERDRLFGLTIGVLSEPE